MVREGIVLIGMAGAGKSTIGRALARRLGFSFTDLDAYISQQRGLTIQQIIDNDGEVAFLRLEEECLQRIEMYHSVIAPGGSIIYHHSGLTRAKRESVIVYLDENYPTIVRRLSNATNRGIVGLRDKTLRQIYLERLPLYEHYAEVTVKPNGRSQHRVIDEIIDRFRKINGE